MIRVCSRSSMLFLYMIWPARLKVAVIFPELSFFSRMANLTGEAQESTNFYGKRSRLLAVGATK